MKIAVTCPHCQRRHLVGEELAGSEARCPCGAIVSVPAAEGPPPPEPSVLVQCPTCLRRYVAPVSLAGSQSHCSCGATLIIPNTPADSPSAIGLPAAIPVSAPAEPEEPPDDPTEYPVEPITELEALPPPTRASLDELLAADAQAASGPPVVLSSLARRRRRQNVLWWFALALGGGSLVALLIVLMIYWSTPGPPLLPSNARPVVQGELGQFSWVLPPQAQGLITANVERFSQSDLWRLMLFVARVGEQVKSSSSGPRVADKFETLLRSLQEFQAVVTPKRNLIGIVRFKTDLSLEEAAGPLSPQPGKSTSLTYRAVPYIQLPNNSGYTAKIASNTFFFAGEEHEFFEALNRWERGEAPPLDTTLRGIWESTQGDVRLALLHPQQGVASKSSLFPGTSGKPEEMFPNLTWIALGMVTDSPLSAQAALGFSNDTAATQFEATLQQARQEISLEAANARNRAPSGQDEASLKAGILQEYSDLLHTLHTSRSNNVLYLRGTWDLTKLESRFRQFGALRSGNAQPATPPPIPVPRGPRPPRARPGGP